jgi:hypothetical protein
LFGFALLLVFAIAVWIAPAMVARTSYVQQLVARNTQDLAATVTVGNVSLGWLSPVVVRDITVQDPNGHPLAQVAALRTEKPLIELAFDSHNLGNIVLEQPRLQLLLKPDGTNLEDALRPWLAKPGPPTEIGCTLEIRDGAVEILEQASGQRWLAEGTNAAVSVPQDHQRPLTLKARTVIQSAGDPPAPCEVELALQRPNQIEGATSPGAGQVMVQTAPLTLQLVGAVARRFATELHLDGTLAGGCTAQWEATRAQIRFDHLRAERFLLTNPVWLGPDELRLASVDLQGELLRENGTWYARNVRLASDLGMLEATGSGVMPANGRDWMPALLAASLQLKADADLARLAALLPHTFRIREATRIVSGRATADLTSQPQDAGQAWNGKLLIHNLAAEHQGRPIGWDQPVELTIAALQQNQMWNVRQLTCRASFLSLAAQGSWAAGNLKLQGDLARFAQETGQFVDLGQLRLAGNVAAEAQWQSSTQGQLTLSGRGTAQSLEIVIPGCRPLREQQLQLQIAASGQLASGRITQIDQGQVQLVSANDQLSLQLTQPVALGPQNVWPVRLQAEGQLASWLPRVQSFLPLTGWEFTGNANLNAEGRWAQELLDLQSVKLNIGDLVARTPSVVIREPAVQLEATGIWNRAAGELRSRSLTLASTSVALRAADVQLQTKDNQLTMTGDMSYRLQLQRALAWLSGSLQKPLDFQLSGETTGRLQLNSTGSVTAAKCTAEVADFVYSTRSTPNSAGGTPADGWRPAWNEPRLQVSADGTYDASQQRISLADLQIAGQALTAAANGTIREPAGRCILELQGKLAYDLQQLVPRLSPQLAAQVQMAGRETRPFQIAGPLFATVDAPSASAAVRPVSTDPAASGARVTLEQMKAQASLGWQSVSVAGLTLGPGNLETQLADGVLTVTPLDLALAEGQLHLAPRVDLGKTPAVLTQDAGPLVQQVRLSPEMCRSWLKFVAPLIADATAAEGQFSVSLEGASLPLTNLAAGNVRGVLNVHSARVGPGPLSQELLTVARQVKAIIDRQPAAANSSAFGQWLELPAQQIPFQMVEGRVHHEGLQLTIGDVVVRTKGSVGIDESLQLLAEVPVRDQWVQNDRYLSALRGQVLQLPVQGSLGRPRVDTQALAGLTRQTVTGAASQLLQQELGRGLDRLLRPPGQQPGTGP